MSQVLSEAITDIAIEQEIEERAKRRAHEIVANDLQDRKSRREERTNIIGILAILTGVLALIGFIAFQAHQSGLRDAEKVAGTTKIKQECVAKGGVWLDSANTCTWSK